ncbi:MAG TPA: HEAT repeat domain-containing protein, partial [Gemmataceae bacterium]|nr:HEAT repeat domain-containing protein [Gemmataceae bacterium]
VRERRPDPLIVAALADKEPLRRMAAAFVLGSAVPEQRQAVRRLLSDSHPKVRFTAGRELVRAGDKLAMPALLALLEQGPPSVATQVEELLARVAGETRPPADLDAASDSSRRECRKAWESWWKDHQERTDLAKAATEERELGFTIVADLDRGRITEYGVDHKERWHVEGFRGPVDAQVLRNGHVLVAENHGSQVTERDRNGKVIWSKNLGQLASSAQRLPNGNTLIAAYNRLVEVKPDGKEVLDISRPDGIYSVRKLRNGQILMLNVAGKVFTLDPKGKEVRSFETGGITSWSSLGNLTNGHVLICSARGAVVEYDRNGRKVWEANVGAGAVSAARMANGNTVVCLSEGRKVVEVNRAGKVIRELRTEGRPWHVERR